jgi:hypothetical protein
MAVQNPGVCLGWQPTPATRDATGLPMCALGSGSLAGGTIFTGANVLVRVGTAWIPHPPGVRVNDRGVSGGGEAHGCSFW